VKHLPAISCAGKAQLPGQRAREIAKGKRRGDTPLQAYHCEHCGHWHVGSSQLPKAARRRPRHENDEE
jgi:hypothetical protein